MYIHIRNFDRSGAMATAAASSSSFFFIYKIKSVDQAEHQLVFRTWQSQATGSSFIISKEEK